MQTNLSLLVFLTQCLIHVVRGGTITRSYKVLHSFNPSGPFTPRSTISIYPSTETNEIVTSIEHENECLSVDILEKLDALVDAKGFYQVKFIDSEDGHSVLTSVDACQVRRANFKESISLTLGDTGSLISASVSPLVSRLAKGCSPPFVKSNEELSFQSNVTYSTTVDGMTIPSILPHTGPPVGLKWIYQPKNGNKPSQTSKDGPPGPGFGAEEDSKPEQQSFLRRYWYIILPMAIMTFFGPEEPPQQGTAKSGGASAAAAGVNTAAAVAANTSSSSAASSNRPKPRRGKRS